MRFTARHFVLLAGCCLALLPFRPAQAQSIEDTCRQQPHRSCIALIAFDTIGKLTHPLHLSGALSYLAPAIAKLGNTREAMRLAAATPLPALQAVAIARIAEVTNDDALFDQADIIYRSLPSDALRVIAQQGMTEALARSNRIDRAVMMADAMPKDSTRTRAYSLIAAHDRTDRYLKITLENLRAEKPIIKVNGLSLIAASRKDAALAAEAIAIARDMQRSDAALALAHIAYNLDDRALMTEAVGMSTFIPIGTQLVIAQLQGSAGDVKPALDTILPVDDLNVRAYILSNLAFSMR